MFEFRLYFFSILYYFLLSSHCSLCRIDTLGRKDKLQICTLALTFVLDQAGTRQVRQVGRNPVCFLLFHPQMITTMEPPLCQPFCCIFVITGLLIVH